ncbi:MAG: hypothetical protein RMX68_006380 [Aulosira sp. ZfuVER01]|nr:hypothetical protein [Aulosira sp. ZfuVER01]MDZ8001548.1 hypothetical protein [Aulosira sp. DedVER01a]MDZ8051584.1 hypothetical protein [Aulosira sp. ZfuCHP01]
MAKLQKLEDTFAGLPGKRKCPETTSIESDRVKYSPYPKFTARAFLALVWGSLDSATSRQADSARRPHLRQ